MSRHGNALAAFRVAIGQSAPDEAMKAAAEMERVGLRDALELCRVLALAQDPRYDSAARRWLILLAGEKGKTLGDLPTITTVSRQPLKKSPRIWRWKGLDSQRAAVLGGEEALGESAELAQAAH